MKASLPRTLWLDIILLVAMLAPTAQAFAGNAWNPPVKTMAEEKEVKKVGAEFLKLLGLTYGLAAALQEENAEEVQRLIPLVGAQLSRSGEQCSLLSNKLKANPEVNAKYASEAAKFASKTVMYTTAGIIVQGDPVWPAVAKAGYPTLAELCGLTVRDIQSAFAFIAQAVGKGAVPSSQDIWRLMNASETGSKRSRYFTMILYP